MRRTAIAVVALLVVSCFVVAVAGVLLYFLYAPTAEAKPLVQIIAPRHGERVRVGELVRVHAIARDETKLTRVELWVDGELQETTATNLGEGVSPLPLLALWQPRSPGRHTLTVRAFNTAEVRAQASLDVEAIEVSDRDEDGVADAVDSCPHEPGSQAAEGCPDSDGDGVRDTVDACPDEAGVPDAVGCPAPGEDDRDGDGVRDVADACPDEAGSPLSEGCPDGDGDGMVDQDDACPDEPGRGDDGCVTPEDFDGDGVLDADDECVEGRGLPEHAGCPDSDGDGVRDVDDACREEPGLAGLGGCPDQDGDGVADDDDLRPQEPGLPEDHGVPHTGGPDSDADGIVDFADLCDSEEGLPEHVGCPPPGEAEDADGDGIADDDELTEVPLSRVLARTMQRLEMGTGQPVPLVLTRLQVEFRGFAVSGDFVSVACYTYNYQNYDPTSEELPIQMYGPYALEGRSWDIAEVLGGRNSFYFQWDSEYSLPVFIECVAYTETGSVDLGEVRLSHLPMEWAGDDITPPRSVGGEEGQWFEVTYRICSVSCELVTLEPPTVLALVRGGNVGIAWEWFGQEALIDGFALYVDGVRQGIAPPDARMTYIDFEPACEEGYDLYMTAYRDPPEEDESPPSNAYYLEGIECPRMVRVTFHSIHSYTLPEDEQRDRLGPLTGYFLANGERLWFDFAHHTTPPPPLLPTVSGWWLRAYQDYDIAYRFRLCNEWAEGGDFSCPAVNYVEVPLGPYDDLSLRAVIEEWDFGGYGYPVNTIFDGDLRLRPWEVDASAHTIEDSRRILDVTVVLGVWGD